MRKSLLCLLAFGFFGYPVQAINLSGELGEDYQRLGLGLGLKTAGFGIDGEMLRNNDAGDIVSVGAQYNFSFADQFLLAPGAKLIYMNHDRLNDEAGIAVGGRLIWNLGSHLNMHGGYYFSPEGLQSGDGDYSEFSVGLGYEFVAPVTMNLGYRQVEANDIEFAKTLHLGVDIDF